MRTIHLYGMLAEKFTPSITIEVTSIPEAIKALGANFKDFLSTLVDYTPGFHIKEGDIFLSQNDLLRNINNKSKDIHIIPVVEGSGKFGTIIIGAFLIWITAGAAAAMMPGAAAGAGGVGGAIGTSIGLGGAAGTTSAMITSALGSIGVGLVLSGISAILFAPPKQEVQEAIENTPNTYFNGAVNTIAQGHPVSVGYGELIVGSAIISAGISIDVANVDYTWLFSSSGTDGWITISPAYYYNTITHIYYNDTTSIYSYTRTIIENAPDYGYGGGLTEYTVNFTYNRLQNRFYVTEGSSGLPLYRSNKYTLGSEEPPEGWGT